ncbi:MAG TPA: hypothetical protein VIH76_08345 [Candidatus Acidoferrales bacterium]
MTRRGSLAYYLAAWICGCLFMSVAICVKDRNALAGADFSAAVRLMYFYFFSLMLGFAPALIFGFLLRRSAALLGPKHPSIWVAAGAMIAAVLVAAIGGWNRNAMAVAHPRMFPTGLVFALTGGLGFTYDEGWWLAIPVGAATAYVLYRIDRAFAPQSSTGDQFPTAAGGRS